MFSDTQVNLIGLLENADRLMRESNDTQTNQTTWVIVPTDSDDDAATCTMVECYGDLSCECEACHESDRIVAAIVARAMEAACPRYAKETKPWWERLVLWLTG